MPMMSVVVTVQGQMMMVALSLELIRRAWEQELGSSFPCETKQENFLGCLCLTGLKSNLQIARTPLASF